MFISILNESKLRNSKNKLNAQINQLMNVPVGNNNLIKVFSMKSLMEKFARVETVKTIKLSKSVCRK